MIYILFGKLNDMQLVLDHRALVQANTPLHTVGLKHFRTLYGSGKPKPMSFDTSSLILKAWSAKEAGHLSGH